jgi:hypothetical protein
MKDKVIENQEKMQIGLLSLNKLNNDELDKLSYFILCESSSEYRHSRKTFFTSEETKEKIIEFVIHFCYTNYTLRNILGIMGFTSMRFTDYDERYFQFLLNNIDNPDNSIKKMLSRFLPAFPQFETLPNKWEYILAIPKIPPKKESISIFHRWIKVRIGNIPARYKNQIIDIYDNYILKNNLHISTKAEYENIIYELKVN